MRNFKLLVASSIASVSTLSTAYFIKNDKDLLASWTTNHEPSVKWNFNWDR